MDIIIKANNLNKKYKNKFALNDFNIEICRGDIYGFVGNNGAGKTTFMKIIMGLSNETSGSYELFGIGNNHTSANERKRISAIIETPSFYPHLSGYQNLKLHQMSMGQEVFKDTIYEIMKKVHLNDESNKKVKNYSLGMKQRLGIARALLTNAELIILDEPTNGLDPSGIIELRGLIVELNRDNKTTFLISSHHILELTHFINKLGIIKKGKLVIEEEFSNINKQIIENNENIEDYIMRMAN